MNLANYTQKSQEAIMAAQQLAQDYNRQPIEPIHLLLAQLQQDQGVVPTIVTKVAGSLLALSDELENFLSNRLKICGVDMDITCLGPPQTHSRLLDATSKEYRVISFRPSAFYSGLRNGPKTSAWHIMV